ncbi:MAG: sensor histidine kinase [Bdellovibrio sp.]
MSFLFLSIPLFFLSYQFNSANQEEILFAEEEKKGLTALVSLDKAYVKNRNEGFEKIKLGREDANTFFTIFDKFKIDNSIILDQSNLILDPQKETYHLIDASQKQSYEIEQALLNLYTHARTLNGEHTNNDVLLSLNLIKIKVNEIMSSYDKFCNKNCSDDFSLNLKNYQGTANGLMELTTWQGDVSFKSLKSFFDISDNLRSQSSYLITEKLQQRIDQYKFRQKTVLLGTFILWIASIICSYLFYTFNLRRIKSYTTQIQNQHDELERVKKLSLIGELAAGIGHEIANPLSIAQMSCELIKDKLDTYAVQMQAKHRSEIDDLLVRIDKMISNIKQIVRSFKSYAYSGDDEKIGLISLKEAVSDALLLIQYKALDQNVTIEKKIDKDLKALGTLHGIEQILVNVLNNAIDAMENSERKKISIEIVSADNFAFIDIADTGPGIRPDLRKKIFTPLFTTKNANNGTGLGLGLSKKICSKFGGDLVLVDSSFGARFRLKLKLNLD